MSEERRFTTSGRVKTDDERALVFEADMGAAAVRAARAGMATMMEMPFEALMRSEDDGLAHEPDYEAAEDEAAFAMKRAGVKAMLRFFVDRSLVPKWEEKQPHARFSLQKLLQAFFTAARAMGIPEVCGMTMEQEGLIFGQTKAAVSFRLGLLSDDVKAAGMHGYKLPGQKKETPKYREAQLRSQAENGPNRNKGKKKRANTQH